MHEGMLTPFSCARIFVIPWNVARPPLSMGFSRQEYWSGLLFPPPVDHPDPGIKHTPPVAPALQADSLPLEPLWNSPCLTEVLWCLEGTQSALGRP